MKSPEPHLVGNGTAFLIFVEYTFGVLLMSIILDDGELTRIAPVLADEQIGACAAEIVHILLQVYHIPQMLQIFYS